MEEFICFGCHKRYIGIPVQETFYCNICRGWKNITYCSFCSTRKERRTYMSCRCTGDIYTYCSDHIINNEILCVFCYKYCPI